MRGNLLAASISFNLCTCMPFSEVLTQDGDLATFRSLQEVIATHDYFVNTDTRSAFQLLPMFVQTLTATLQQRKITAANEVAYAQKINHKLRSMHAYAYYTRCFALPYEKKSNAPRPRHLSQLERDWRKRYNMQKIDDKRFCYLFLSKMKELLPGQIDLQQADNSFYTAVMNNATQSPTATPPDIKTTRTAFRQLLNTSILAHTQAAMRKHLYLFPFAAASFADLCREHFLHRGPGAPENPYKNLDRTVCEQLNEDKLARMEIYHEKIPGHEQSYTPPQFTDVTALTASLNVIITKLNSLRAALNEVLQAPGATQKKPLLVPWLKLLNEANLSDTEIIALWENYMNTATDYAQDGYLPLLFSATLQKASGDIHLQRRGRWLGFGKVELSLLKPINNATTTDAVYELQQQLMTSWLELKNNEHKVYSDGEQLFHLVISNEIAVAQLLLQQPAHAIVINHLLLDYQFDSCTPKWLRIFQNTSLAIDLAFIPLAIIASVITGGVAVVPLMLMANAANFLWIGVATAKQRVAANRYKMLQRALLSGNSTQVAAGLQRLEKMHQQRKELIASSTIGSTLTLSNMKMLTNSTKALSATAVDLKAGFMSDLGGFVGDEDSAELITGDTSTSCLQQFLHK